MGGLITPMEMHSTHSIYFEKDRNVVRKGPHPQFFVHYHFITDSYFYVVQMEEEPYELNPF